MVLVVPIVLSRGLEQVDLADNLREATDSADRESRASNTVREKTSTATDSDDLGDAIFREPEVPKKKRGRKRK